MSTDQRTFLNYSRIVGYDCKVIIGDSRVVNYDHGTFVSAAKDLLWQNLFSWHISYSKKRFAAIGSDPFPEFLLKCPPRKCPRPRPTTTTAATSFTRGSRPSVPCSQRNSSTIFIKIMQVQVYTIFTSYLSTNGGSSCFLLEH